MTLKCNPIPICVAGLTLAALVSNANANSYQVSFTASGFVPIFTSTSAPTDPVTGSITYSAAGSASPVTSIISISLTIDEHNYSVAEVGWGLNGSNYLFGGLVNGINSTNAFAGIPDFVLEVPVALPTNSTPAFFYTTQAGVDTWIRTTGSATISAVPEPSGYVLITTGLGILMVASMRRVRKSGAGAG